MAVTKETPLEAKLRRTTDEREDLRGQIEPLRQELEEVKGDRHLAIVQALTMARGVAGLLDQLDLEKLVDSQGLDEEGALKLSVDLDALLSLADETIQARS